MKNLVSGFTQQLKEAIEIAKETRLKPNTDEIRNVLILGMGGSGIGGTIAAQILDKDLKVPVLSCKDYTIPAFADKHTLIIVSSYSGNTEETLSALSEAKEKTSNIVCLTSGGKAEEIALSSVYDLIKIPGGIPPRAALGYSFPQLFSIFAQKGLLDWNVTAEFQSVVSLLEGEQDFIQSEAKRFAHVLSNKMAVIYAESSFEGVCVRFRQQLNENSKKLCWHHVIPEMNHNELVGWRSDASDKVVVLFRNESDLPRNQHRMELSKEIFAKYNPEILEIQSKGENKLQRSLYLIHLCDWISVYIADINQTDPIEIEVINYFKGELAKSSE